MLIEVAELCHVDCIHEENAEKEELEYLTAIRTVLYQSPEDTLLEAFKDYDSNFNTDNIVSSNDEFDGGCLDTIKYISISEVEE